MSIYDSLLPILYLIILGMFFRWTGFISIEVVEGIKKLIVNLILPSVLFTVFLDMEMKISYLGLWFLVALICIGLYGLGLVLGKWLVPHHPWFPFLLTGFEYGMLGVSLFGGAYGLEAVGYIAVVDLPHELFIWFVFAPLMMVRRDGRSNPAAILKMFATSPVTIALTAGLMLNGLGLAETVKTAPLLSSLYATLKLLTAMVVPLILLVVGYGIQIKRKGLGDVAILVGIRYGLIVPSALLLNHFVLANWLGLGPGYQAAFFILLILPPPYIIPLFMQKATEEEEAFVSNSLAVSTIISLICFSLYLIINPVI
nr:hypothetical protein [uncultured Cohaesibacter sp.]